MAFDGHGNWNENENGIRNGNGVAEGGQTRKVSVRNGERARVVDVRRSRRIHPLQDGEAP